MLTILRDMGSYALHASPQARALGFTLMEIAAGEATVRCPYSPDLVGDVGTGVVAGGVVTTLLDHTCGHAVLAALDSFRPIATLDLRIDYQRAAEPGCDIVAHAQCYKLTKSVAFVRAIAFDRDKDDPLATVQATFMLDSSRSGRRSRTESDADASEQSPQDGQASA
jgi:uncharacterized protein (TIGR00369 family)